MVGNKYLIMGSGYTVFENKESIDSYIAANDPITIGINGIVSLFYPDIHFFTNTKQFIKFSKSINYEKSRVILGINISEKTIKNNYNGPYERVNYKDEEGLTLNISKEYIQGRFRTAGVLSIAWAFAQGAKSIDIVGMDGYTFHSKKSLLSNENNQHCYGKGYTDDADWNKCKIKDDIVYSSLRSLKNYGINFRILTPTKFKDFYKSNIMKEYK